jgi:high-affinity nickel-transport protein
MVGAEPMNGHRAALSGAQRRDRAGWVRMSGFFGAVVLVHLLGWGLFWLYSRRYPTLGGLGALAYTFGLRHAFDADHIAAIDNTTRKLLQEGRRPLGIGFFFSLGHATIVLSLTAALALATGVVESTLPAVRGAGAYVGTSVSGAFMWIIGILNLIVFIDVWRIFLDMRTGAHDEQRLERRLLDRGLLSRLFLGRLASRIGSSWHMYPLGLLFGLGFDTATEVGLLAIAGGVATHHVPFLAVMSLPLLFTAGMSLVDTVDGAVMSHAYGWASSNPVRRIFYNLTVTGLSVVVALVIGTIELLHVTTRGLGLHGGFWSFAANLDLSRVGYAITALFVVAWAVAALAWTRGRPDQRLMRAAD